MSEKTNAPENLADEFRKCVQTVNVFGKPMPDCVRPDILHDEATPRCETDAMCMHHVPLYEDQETKAPESLADEFWRLVAEWYASLDDIPETARIVRFSLDHRHSIEAALRRATPDQEPVLARVEQGRSSKTWLLKIGEHVIDERYGTNRLQHEADAINAEYQRLRAKGELP